MSAKSFGVEAESASRRSGKLTTRMWADGDSDCGPPRIRVTVSLLMVVNVEDEGAKR